MKKILLLILILAQLCVQAVTRPLQALRITDHVSMGMTEREFVALLSGTLNLTATNEANATGLCRYKYNYDLLKDMLRYDEATQQYFAYPAVTKMYVVRDPTPLWPQHHRIEFIFYRPYGSNKPFVLFAIHATHKVLVGDVNAVFEQKLQAGIENRNGEKPLILNTTYTLKDAAPVPARMALWKMATNREILFVPDNGALIFAEFTYVDELMFKEWEAATNAYKEAMKVAK